ncbi:hypothetical protein HJC23_003387 [Cyclotella cryptica]|uniref:Uncharacterized protein n=1 Tax=Cyclotella cryptica TaxID=29204 RepID=A0ABD3QY74_9STRA|eukprot:CCRYP_000962-RA/>CCRYP_000962-RA protein AED:0.43 eAED:0.43 QI:0/1/0/1/1/1/2/0/323
MSPISVLELSSNCSSLRTNERTMDCCRKSMHEESNDCITAPIPIGGRYSQHQIDDQESTLGIYETAFRKIQDATGVSNANEVIRKIVGQEATTENLKALTAQNQSKIEELTAMHESLLSDVEKKKCNISGASKASKAIDEQQEILYSRSSQCERSKSQCDRLAFVLMSIKAGMEHIHEKIPDEFERNHTISTEELLPDVIRSTGDVLVDIHQKAKENELDLDLDMQDSRETELNKSALRVGSLHVRRPVTAGMTEERSFNQRIVLPSPKELSVFDYESDDETRFGELDAEEEISREGVKRASSNVIAVEERRKLRSRKPEEDY